MIREIASSIPSSLRGVPSYTPATLLDTQSRLDSAPNQTDSGATQTRLFRESFRIIFDSEGAAQYLVNQEAGGAARFNVAMAVDSFRLYIFGRLRGVTRERLRRAAEALGGRLVRRPSA